MQYYLLTGKIHALLFPVMAKNFLEVESIEVNVKKFRLPLKIH